MKTVTTRLPQTDLSQLQARDGTPDGETFATAVVANATARIILQPAAVGTAERIANDSDAVRGIERD